jgi:hypothetical protein
MVRQTENRESERHKHEAALLYAFNDSEKYYSATMCNYGEDGMCFVAGYSLEPGSKIFIRIENYPDEAAGRNIKEWYNAVVQWCEPMPNSDAFFYHVGVKYSK